MKSIFILVFVLVAMIFSGFEGIAFSNNSTSYNFEKRKTFTETDSISFSFKNHLGIQVNPCFTFFFRKTITRGNPWVFALRYGRYVKPWIVFGVDSRMSTANLKDNSYFYISYFEWDIGFYIRSLLPKKKISPFLETKIFYYKYDEKMLDFNHFVSFQDNGFSYYLAPGISFLFLQNRLQFDAMAQTNYRDWINGGLSLGVFEFSYRILYNFGRK